MSFRMDFGSSRGLRIHDWMDAFRESKHVCVCDALIFQSRRG